MTEKLINLTQDTLMPYLVVNHSDFDLLESLKNKRLASAPSQATVPHHAQVRGRYGSRCLLPS